MLESESLYLRKEMWNINKNSRQILGCDWLCCVVSSPPMLLLRNSYKLKSQLIIVNASTKRSSAVGAAHTECVWTEPLTVVSAVTWDRVRSPPQASVWVTSVAAVAALVQEARGGREGHHLVVRHTDQAVGVRLVESAQLLVHVRHQICIAKCFL